MDRALLKQLNKLRKTRVPVLLATDLTTGTQRLILREDAENEEQLARFSSGASGQDKTTFYRAYLPSPRLVIIGAVHIAQHLISPAKDCGFDVSVIDPRTAFASEERFGGVTLHADWPDDILNENPLDAYCAVAALTHDPKIDDIPLKLALEADCFYVGALGSRKTHATRVERLTEAGLRPVDLARIHAPIGLDIGAANPAEIAIAILAEIVATLRGRS